MVVRSIGSRVRRALGTSGTRGARTFTSASTRRSATVPHLPREWGPPLNRGSPPRHICIRPSHICTGTWGSPLPHLHRDLGFAPPTSAPGRRCARQDLGLTPPTRIRAVNPLVRRLERVDAHARHNGRPSRAGARCAAIGAHPRPHRRRDSADLAPSRVPPGYPRRRAAAGGMRRLNGAFARRLQQMPSFATCCVATCAVFSHGIRADVKEEYKSSAFELYDETRIFHVSAMHRCAALRCFSHSRAR